MRLQPIRQREFATDVEILATHQNLVTKTVTLDASKFPAGTDGRKIAKVGTVLGKITATGLYAPYDPGASDGTEKADCILFNTIDLTDGNAVAAAITQGVVLEARCTGLDEGAKNALRLIEFR